MAQQLNSTATVLLLFLASTIATAQNTVSERFELPGHGYIELQVPTSWRSQISQPPGSLPPTIKFTPASGQPFTVLITPMFSVGEDMVIPSLNQVRGNVEHSAAQAELQTLESEIQIQEMRGNTTRGYYFSATDKEPKPGGFKFMTQGMMRVGELAPIFTVLTNSGSEQIVGESLKMLQDAKHVKIAP